MKIDDRIHKISIQLQPFFTGIVQIQVVYLYGSFVSRTKFYDIDLAVLCRDEFVKTKGAFFKILRWGTMAESYLQPRYSVDLRLLNDAPVVFQHEVICTGAVIFERNRDARVIFETQVLNEYMDYLPIIRFFNQNLLTKLKS